MGPTGTLLVEVETNSKLSIATIDVATGKLTPIDTGAAAGDPAWRPDGRLIAYQTPSGIYTARPDGTGRHRVTTDGRDRHAAWSPDGKLIAFAGRRNGEADLEILVVPAAGGTMTRLTHNTIEDRGPTWSPDGTQIAYVSAPNGNRDIFVIDADGTGVPKPLTKNKGNDVDPAWFADSIVWASEAAGDGKGTRIWSMDSDGDGEHQLVKSNDVDHDPTWSPDGNFIAFNRAGAAKFIVIADREGHEVKTIEKAGIFVRLPSWYQPPP